MAPDTNQLSPVQPSYVFRGHSAHIHSVTFLRGNTRLLTGDTDGWIVLWHLTTRRPVAVWRAHESSILGAGDWGNENIITHGRDNKLKVWQLRAQDEDSLSKALPVEGVDIHRKQPWLFHTLHVNSLNFCSYSMCSALGHFNQNEESISDQEGNSDVLIAAPGSHEGQINVFHLPTEQLVSIVPPQRDTKPTLVMAVEIYTLSSSSERLPPLRVIAGYENAQAAVHEYDPSSKTWSTIYTALGHSQPILSLHLTPSKEVFFTSSADDRIVRHSLHDGRSEPQRNAGTLKEIRTKHSGQQSLRIRSDGRIFATAGWDGRARVYSAKSMKELAVLKWHKEGCYAVSFAEILDPVQAEESSQPQNALGGDPNSQDASELGEESSLAKRQSVSITVREKRELKSQRMHWLAVGAKDGKVSLWEIY